MGFQSDQQLTQLSQAELSWSWSCSTCIGPIVPAQIGCCGKVKHHLSKTASFSLLCFPSMRNICVTGENSFPQFNLYMHSVKLITSAALSVSCADYMTHLVLFIYSYHRPNNTRGFCYQMILEYDHIHIAFLYQQDKTKDVSRWMEIQQILNIITL